MRTTIDELEYGDLYELRSDCWIMLTQVDYQKEEGLWKFFSSPKEADDYLHSFSKSQNPDWHLKSCPRCKEDGKT